MIVTHVSDCHGRFAHLNLHDSTHVICSGDFMPSFSRGIVPIEVPRQTEWCISKAPEIVAWLAGRVFIHVDGNHDYCDTLVTEIRAAGGKAHDLYREGAYILDWSDSPRAIVGFPHVPAFTREWNYELEPRAMQYAVAELESKLCAGDVLVAHSPIHGVLDRNGRGTRCGNVELRNMLMKTVKAPSHVLCGHIHESAGKLGNWHGIYVSNAACVSRRIEL